MIYRDWITSNWTNFGLMSGFILFFVFWSLIWKGLALWRAARRKEVAWFVILLVVNTLGILEIIYYFLIAKSDEVEKK